MGQGRLWPAGEWHKRAAHLFIGAHQILDPGCRLPEREIDPLQSNPFIQGRYLMGEIRYFDTVSDLRLSGSPNSPTNWYSIALAPKRRSSITKRCWSVITIAVKMIARMPRAIRAYWRRHGGRHTDRAAPD
jgi:hypothetical protein